MEDNTRMELKELYLQLESLERHPAWQRFLVAMAYSEQEAYKLSLGANEGTTLAKHFGAYHALRSVNSWLSREKQMVKAQFDAFSKE